MKLDARAIKIAKACNTLLPLVHTARELLKRRPSISAVELAAAVRGLRGWAAAHGNGDSAIDVAIAIATGSTAYDIVRSSSGTRRTSKQVKEVHAVWRGRQLRDDRG
ncbi:MAG: hypothetical protein JWO36_7419 [Myxococcales bacterium]|nr:hypothetical protein [Myxococcales bacterium]